MGEYAELELLQTLERGLSDAYMLFHSVDWSRGVGGNEQHGEIDIVIVSQAGDMLLVEVKFGDVNFTPDGIIKTYGTQVKNITRQIGIQYSALKSWLEDSGLLVHLRHLLVTPHLKVQTETAQWPRELIVDSADNDNIVTRISHSMGSGIPNALIYPRVVAFFENKFQDVPDVFVLAGRIQQSATRMSAGLATWVPRVTSASGLLAGC